MRQSVYGRELQVSSFHERPAGQLPRSIHRLSPSQSSRSRPVLALEENSSETCRPVIDLSIFHFAVRPDTSIPQYRVRKAY